MDLKKVTGTIMLSSNDGKNSFLVQSINESYTFLEAVIQPEITNMAAILKAFEKEASIDISRIDLVELVSINFNDVRTPLFVFEMTEAANQVELPVNESGFSWENSDTLSDMLEQMAISEVPVFECEK